MNRNQAIHYILENLKVFDMTIETAIILGQNGTFVAPASGRKYTYQEIRIKAEQFRALMNNHI